ncbi:TauD/TfdA family dioxygenase [Flavilitoribacter nigricans]|uniref:Taurine catabolism dioxygenase TauD n=1 Tax=Flavilitoribacter nigricans (strain ATCC 23147 / DSM 23189 / NBRC 102662 / NCIMB 1420 / SS-2) TaxID=1122177 RepID=A0A2D0NFH1_FLAN2|nr:TauD/TfdA family dioxygenase [Flavilitoribacter nigricans]PHN07235.1 taurine catabolism dioxygenase TauD [Flavilitoribacter nigricans DSM 23189 = NBRC 102662]
MNIDLASLPPRRTGPTTWSGPDMAARRQEWIWRLSPAEIGELEAAAEAVLDSGADLTSIRAADFVLPELAPRLLELRLELINGRGFALLRGLPVADYSYEKTAAIFYGLGTHLGNTRAQNAQGDILGHVRNLGMDSRDPNVRIYQTKERQTFHTDSCDVVGLLCLQPALSGGRSLLVSADTVFNEIRDRRPDLLKLLLEPIATDRRGEVPAGMLPYLLIPVFSYYEGRITPFYQRQYIDSAQRFPDAPRLTDRHVEALDLFDAYCNDPALHFSMMLEKGDMQFVYNHAMLHDRTGFEDAAEPEKRRHLLRLWLSTPGDRPLPPEFATRYGSVEIGNRGGVGPVVAR